jgi:lipopolysaccharide heptosyltransferase II
LPFLRKKIELASIKKILVVRLSSIGDIILTTPLLRSLKKTWPDAHVTFVIKKQFEELLASCPYIDELITFDKNEGLPGLQRIKHSLKQQKLDLFLDIHKNWRSRYLRLGLGAGKITSYRKLIFKRTLLIGLKINLYGEAKPVYERYFDSVKPYHITYDGMGTEIHIPEGKSNKVREALTKAGFCFDSPLVILCPAATYLNKQWKPQGFVETAQRLIRDKSVFIVIHGGNGDKQLCSDIANQIGNRAVSMAGMFSLSESAALLHFASLVVANDSGLLHLAQSQQRPVIGIYGPTTRELGYFPVDLNSTVIETNVSCRPCTHNGLNHCPKKHFKCMNDITADQIIDAAFKYIP